MKFLAMMIVMASAETSSSSSSPPSPPSSPHAHGAGSVGSISDDMNEIFLKYDVHDPFNDAPPCQSDEFDAIVCPPASHDETIPCGDREAIEEHCANILLNINYSNSDGEYQYRMRGGMEPEHTSIHRGCVTYVSYHVKNIHEYNGCCMTNYCEAWLDQRLQYLEEEQQQQQQMYNGGSEEF